MRHPSHILAVLALLGLSACGSSTEGVQTPTIKFSRLVSFGDSLSDVGTYAVGTVAALRGGKWTVNGAGAPGDPARSGRNWSEHLADQLRLAAPCPAKTGLGGDPQLGLNVPTVNHRDCFAYAQGGARISDPAGSGHASPLGALTVPVARQIQHHLAVAGGRFGGDELVTLIAGGDDIAAQAGQLAAGAMAAGQAAASASGAAVLASRLVALLSANANEPAAAARAIQAALAAESARPGHSGDSIARAAVAAAASQPGNSALAASSAHGPLLAIAQDAARKAAEAAGQQAAAHYAAAEAGAAVARVAAAAQELVALVKSQLLAKGANYVVVGNIPDILTTPYGRELPADARALIGAMLQAFNSTLAAGLAAEARVTLLDIHAVTQDQALNPGPYGLSNVKDRACDLAAAGNPLHLSLTCNLSTVMAGDVSHYQWADDTQPTPYSHWMLARLVARNMATKGWL
jgi:outer membrane lipase/esterase